jgi:hypothetical protein
MTLKRFDYVIQNNRSHVHFGTIWESDEDAAHDHARKLARLHGHGYRVVWVKHVNVPERQQ